MRNFPLLPRTIAVAAALMIGALVVSTGTAAVPAPAKAPPRALVGTWTLVAADVRHPDGSVGRDFGESPRGSMMIDARGRYTLLIYKSERPKFASGDRARGTAEEYRETVIGISTHFGTLSVDTATHTLNFAIEEASFSNWNGTSQIRPYQLKGAVLSYTVAARPNGDVPISVWKRTS